MHEFVLFVFAFLLSEEVSEDVWFFGSDKFVTSYPVVVDWGYHDGSAETVVVTTVDDGMAVEWLSWSRAGWGLG